MTQILIEPYYTRASELVIALRSGRYQQGLGKLRSHSEKYCCLGVACEISQLDDWETNVDWGYAYLQYYNSLPFVVQNYYGFNSASGSIFLKKSGRVTSLMQLNDDNGYSFEEIAKVIEDSVFDPTFELFKQELYA